MELKFKFFPCLGLDPSGYRGASRHDDEGDAFLGGRAQMTDEERFKVVIMRGIIYT